MGKWKELALKLMSLDKDDLMCSTRLVSHLDESLHFTPRYLNSGLNFIQWNLIQNILTMNVVNDAYHSWRDHGISQICDITEDKKYKLKPSQMDYNSLIDAIPHNWRRSLQRHIIKPLLH